MNHNMCGRFIIVFAFVVLSVISFGASGCDRQTATPSIVATTPDNLAAISRAYENKQSGIVVQASGFVGRVLDDDPAPPRHQKFIVRLTSGQTLLIAHNIDLAPRIDDLKTNDRVSFRGQYEWSQKGGTVHMTHRDLARRFNGGWVDHNGKRYE